MSRERILKYIEKLHKVAEDVEEKLQNEDISNKVVKITGTDFENIVYDSLISVGLKKEEISHSSQKFPDFVLEDLEDGDKVGVEVKKTDAAKWEIIGGSVYESVKSDIADTFVLMAKFGGEKPEVRLKKYEECIADLKVTHSPRFYLNLDLEEGEDYLTKNNAKDLLELSGEELNRKIRELLRTKKSTWWSEGTTVAFSDLSHEEKGMYLNDGIALFPEVFKGDYSKFTPWLVYSCLVWCGNVRDIFSAGGNVYDEELCIYLSAIMNRTLCNIESIKQRIIDMSQEEQLKFWGEKIDDVGERIDVWLKLVENNLKISNELILNNQRVLNDENNNRECITTKVKAIFMNRLKCKLKKD